MTDTELRRAFIAGVEFGQQDLSPSLHLHMPTIEAEAASRYPVPDTGDTAALDELSDASPMDPDDKRLLWPYVDVERDEAFLEHELEPWGWDGQHVEDAVRFARIYRRAALELAVALRAAYNQIAKDADRMRVRNANV